MSNIVIDKSYLQAIKLPKLLEIAGDNKLLMTTALAYELFTEVQREQKEYFYKKLYAIQDSIVYVRTVIELIKYEWENQIPCTPIEKHFSKDKFEPKLFDPGYSLGDSQKRMIQFFRDEWEGNEVEVFRILGSKASQALPKLQAIKAGSRIDEIQPMLEELANNPELVKQIYRQIRLENIPPVEIIDENWAFFRRTQIYLAYGAEYTRKFGSGKIENVAKRFDHDVIDIEYLIIGVLTNALATNDNDLKRFFSLFCPNGKLFQITAG